jgi:hypothetical protein
MMEYRKPELLPLGAAHQLIASALLKGPYMGDASGDPSDHTPTPAAYQADE